MQMAASKRFHKFWFLVLENPGFGWDFLVIGLASRLMLEPSVREVGWGTNEYWGGLMAVLCQSLAGLY